MSAVKFLYGNRLCLFLLMCILQLATGSRLYAQSKADESDNETLPKAQLRRERIKDVNPDTLIVTETIGKDTLVLNVDGDGADSLVWQAQESVNDLETRVDTILLSDDALLELNNSSGSSTKEKKVFIPDPVKATWLAAVFPGGGQIYNRKYWKLPIIYGGFVGCAYALSWNGQMYSDYSQAYLDIMDDNPDTDSYLDMLPPGYNVDANMEYLKKVIKRKKDYYRRYRDLSMFIFIGVYAISIIDAYVDAELASFDISKDLTMKVSPAVIDRRDMYSSGNRNHSYGLQCSFEF